MGGGGGGRMGVLAGNRCRARDDDDDNDDRVIHLPSPVMMIRDSLSASDFSCSSQPDLVYMTQGLLYTG